MLRRVAERCGVFDQNNLFAECCGVRSMLCVMSACCFIIIITILSSLVFVLLFDCQRAALFQLVAWLLSAGGLLALALALAIFLALHNQFSNM